MANLAKCLFVFMYFRAQSSPFIELITTLVRKEIVPIMIQACISKKKLDSSCLLKNERTNFFLQERSSIFSGVVFNSYLRAKVLAFLYLHLLSYAYRLDQVGRLH